MGHGSVHIGTSGWHYKHWLGRFHPEKLPSARMLEFYSQHFDTVELNTTFYGLPPLGGLASWREGSAKEFCFAAKGSRFITHMKKLKDPELAIERYFERVDRLRPKLGPIVFQLPPHWEADAERLAVFLRALPNRHRYAFELRDPSWHTAAIRTLLRKHNAAFCIFEIGGFRSEFPITADFTYVRLHGPDGAYQGSYSRDQLKAWADRIARWREELKAVYIYFDNDQAAYAAENALALKQLVG
jgi:uncharacterized protein YecE (DUF72 family)